MTSGIYSITHTGSGKVYVGSAIDCRARWMEHRKRLRRNAHHSKPLQGAWNKYGAETFMFAVIETVESSGNLIAREQHWIDSLRSADSAFGYNVAKRAGNTLGVKHTPEARAKIRAARARQVITPEHRRNIGLGSKGRRMTEANKAILVAISTGRVVSAETRALMSKARKGQRLSQQHIEAIKTALKQPDVLAKMSRLGSKQSPETKAKISARNIGRQPTPETRLKLSAWQIGRKFTPEHRAKISAAMRGRKRTP